MANLYGVSTYERNDPEHPYLETSENFIGYVICERGELTAIAEYADVHVQFYGEYNG